MKVEHQGLLKAESKRRNMTYKDLTARLEAMGVRETELKLPYCLAFTIEAKLCYRFL